MPSSSFTISLLLWILAIIPAVAYVYFLPREMGVYQGVDALPVLSDSEFDHVWKESATHCCSPRRDDPTAR